MYQNSKKKGRFKMKLLLSSLLIFIFIFAFSYSASTLDKSIILYFSFNQGSGGTVTDESGNGNDGTLKGNVNGTLKRTKLVPMTNLSPSEGIQAIITVGLMVPSTKLSSMLEL